MVYVYLLSIYLALRTIHTTRDGVECDLRCLSNVFFFNIGDRSDHSPPFHDLDSLGEDSCLIYMIRSMQIMSLPGEMCV